jgi:hypothetical protein
VALYRADLQGQAVGYFGVGQALGDQMADALLLWRHRVQRGPADDGCGCAPGRVALRWYGADGVGRVPALFVEPVHHLVQHRVLDAPLAEDLEGRQGACLDERCHLAARQPEFSLDL